MPKKSSAKLRELPLIPLRDTVVFPRVTVPVIVKREKSLKALEAAMRHGRAAVVAAQRDPDRDDPGLADVYPLGTLVRVRELVKQDDKTVRALLEGEARVRLRRPGKEGSHLTVAAEPLPVPPAKKSDRAEALSYSVLNQFRRVVNMGANVPFDVLLVILNVTDPWLMGDLVAANLELKTAEKQAVLEARTVEEKLTQISRSLSRQVKLLQMASKIQADTGRELDKMQREIFLREQLKAIEKELGQLGAKTDGDGLREALVRTKMPPETLEKALKEYERLRAMPSYSPEQAHLRAYLELLAELPWRKADEAKIDVPEARRILDADHYGLEKVKERILEFLAVRKLVGRMRGPILCFVGPPGMGKTSLGRSIARATGRKFWRVSLGGIRDEAEIRGHRRTYVGALPGRLIQGLNAAKTRNPVFMLDEIDKVGADHRGDPTAALLEALDPEQNSQFSDHYLEVPFDLSDVMFVATANVLDDIPHALRDRMEVIEFPGYTEEEKLHIAEDHLIPKTLKDNGLDAKRLKFAPETVRAVIRLYTREAGVRNLERELAAVCRKAARRLAEGEKVQAVVAPADLPGYLGPERFLDQETEVTDTVGVVNGLAWTEAGGDILQVEATKMAGRGNLQLTGHLGKVMQESAQAAYSYVRSVAARLGVKEPFHKMYDVHVHVPQGAIPKDGPSAGVTIATAVVSMLTGRPVRRDTAMTGEVTLRGRVLEIGGVKEKVLAAHRAGLKRVIMPARNAKDLVDVPEAVRREMEFIPVKQMSEVLEAALVAPASVRQSPKTAKSKKR